MGRFVYRLINWIIINVKSFSFHVQFMVECCFTSTETVCLIGTGAQDVHLDFHTALEL